MVAARLRREVAAITGRREFIQTMRRPVIAATFKRVKGKN
jgi:hypothetical protein